MNRREFLKVLGSVAAGIAGAAALGQQRRQPDVWRDPTRQVTYVDGHPVTDEQAALEGVDPMSIVYSHAWWDGSIGNTSHLDALDGNSLTVGDYWVFGAPDGITKLGESTIIGF